MFYTDGATVTTPDGRGLKNVAIFASLLSKPFPIQGRERKCLTTTKQR